MARELTFKLKRKEYKAVPRKIDRRKLYGWTEVLALDDDGNPCKLVNTDDTGRFIMGKGDTGLGILSPGGRWVDRAELKTVRADGAPAELLPSSFEQTIPLTEKVSYEQFLDYSITDFYQLDEADAELIKKIGNDIYTFSYCYVGECEGSPAFLLTAAGNNGQKNLYLLIGIRNFFEMLGYEQPGFIDDTIDDEEEGDDLDFSML